jgi:hypothetical protein
MKDTNMKTNRMALMVATAFAAFTLAGAATAQYRPAGDDGIAASPKVRQALNERKASAAPVVATAPVMACPMCADVKTTEVNRQAKAGENLTGAATKVVFKHTCPGCDAKLTTVGEGKARHTIATHICTAAALNNMACCASN